MHGFIYFPVSVLSGSGKVGGNSGLVLKEALWRLLEFPPLWKRKQTENSLQIFQQTNQQTNRGCFFGSKQLWNEGNEVTTPLQSFVGFFRRTEYPEWRGAAQFLGSADWGKWTRKSWRNFTLDLEREGWNRDQKNQGTS